MVLNSSDVDRLHGAVYTNPEIVELILDLVGYTTDKPLYTKRLLDPAFGDGAFIYLAAKRLLETYFANGGTRQLVVADLRHCLRGVELQMDAFLSGRSLLRSLLHDFNLTAQQIEHLLNEWLVLGDFLLWQQPIGCLNDEIKFDFVVGNPPYVRQELIPAKQLKQYRALYKTIYDRADLYIPFIQHGLDLLSATGKLGYICSDRFTRNRYGTKIREYITNRFATRYVIDLHRTSPFSNDVSAYPMIFVLDADKEPSETRAAILHDVNHQAVQCARDYLLHAIESSAQNKVVETHTFPKWFEGAAPWIIVSQKHLNVLAKLEQHPLITSEEHGIKVGIGVATGADLVYIVREDAGIEPEVLLPLVTTRDIRSGEIRWSGNYVINVFQDNGTLIDLERYPRLARHFKMHEETLRRRNVAKRNPPENWYRTIDRIWAHLTHEPKLLIPDIKAKNHIVKDAGQYYPHHNLYFVLPGNWDIDALKAVLKSSITKFFIWSYTTKIRGDYLRYQAQYLRKIHLPQFRKVAGYQEELKRVLTSSNQIDLDHVVAALFDLTTDELNVIWDAMR